MGIDDAFPIVSRCLESHLVGQQRLLVLVGTSTVNASWLLLPAEATMGWQHWGTLWLGHKESKNSSKSLGSNRQRINQNRKSVINKK